jgi:hypothetical protein
MEQTATAGVGVDATAKAIVAIANAEDYLAQNPMNESSF